jgi:hypothetical protein
VIAGMEFDEIDHWFGRFAGWFARVKHGQS